MNPKPGEILPCQLPGCKETFIVKRGREHQRYCSAKHRWKGWLLRQLEKLKNGNRS